MKEKKIENVTSDSTEQTTLPDDIKMHQNGILYKEIFIQGRKKPIRLFNTLKPQRLDDEKYEEYVIRRKLNNIQVKEKKVFYNSMNKIPYINTNKKNK